MAIRKGDTVMVITGKEKGKTGKVMRIIPGRGRAIVEKLNLVKRHMKPNQQMRQGGIVDQEASIHISNLMLFDEKSNKPSRVRYEKDKKGKKVRVLVRTGEAID